MGFMDVDFNGFSAYLSRNGRKTSTIYRHQNCLRMLAQNLIRFDLPELERFLVGLKEQNKRHSYLNHFIDTANLYCEYQGLPRLVCKRWCDQSFAKATMSDDEIEALLTLPPPSVTRIIHSKPYTYLYNPSGYQIWTVFFSICAFTGMRPGEVAHLTVDDVDWGRGIFTVDETKTGEPRSVPIPPNIETALKEHLAGLSGQLLFPSQKSGRSQCGRDGTVFDSVDWHYNFQQRIKRLGIKRRNLTPYSLRHSLITRLLEEDVNLFKVQKIVGHKRIETTAQYTHLTTKDIQEAIRKHPAIRKATEPRNILRALIESFSSLFERDNRFDKSIEDHGDEIIIRVKIKSDQKPML